MRRSVDKLSRRYTYTRYDVVGRCDVVSRCNVVHVVTNMFLFVGGFSSRSSVVPQHSKPEHIMQIFWPAPPRQQRSSASSGNREEQKQDLQNTETGSFVLWYIFL